MTTIDYAKRRRIMQRSMQLGHCICDPRRPCPCDVFTQQGICPCAGERPPEIDPASVRLTEHVHNAGCASKIAPADLEAVLGRLPAIDDPNVLSGLPAGDDAGVYRLADGTCLVQTVDVMTAVVDDAELFGRICAANCLSDIYAMGGVPKTALSILAFPSETLPGQLMYLMMKGAMAVFAEAGVALLGGHSVKDEEIKLGFAITGILQDAAAVSHETARVGDRLVLTKPLGCGVLNFARQIGRSVDLSAAEASMATLNRAAAEAMQAVGVSAATDVTGFGLFGHLIRMARHSKVTAEVWADALPAFEGAIAALADGVVPGAIERNREFVADDIAVDDGVEEARVHLGFDAQTSGGLLMAVPAARHAELLEQLRRRGATAWTIGRIAEASSGTIHVVHHATDGEEIPMAQPTAQPEPAPDKDHGPQCCAEFFGDRQEHAPAPAGPSNAGDAAAAFGRFMAATGAGGAIDEITKELITFALVVHARCEPCVKAHVKRATSMGISRAQLDEAAWLATAMGGAPIWMFYKEMMGD